ncbi:hypothetical protein [Pseudomonas sp. NPDC086278]|uniref:hypothetical protein n=1 Tax=Pseudomonas sp. NPDC086278 TaxID=3390646 RepID=UPI003D020BA0
MPGHTEAEVALYDEKNNVLLSGDHLYPSSFFVGNMKDYVASVSATLNVIMRFDKNLSSAAFSQAFG